jgi:hypothetical protein
MAAHQPCPPPVHVLIYSSNMRLRGSSRGRECGIVILGNRRNPWQLLSELKHLRKNICTASCPLLQLRLCQSKCEITGNNYTVVRGFGKLKHAAYSIHLLAPNSRGPKVPTMWSGHRLWNLPDKARSKPLLLLDPRVPPPSTADAQLPSHHFLLLTLPGDLPMFL